MNAVGQELAKKNLSLVEKLKLAPMLQMQARGLGTCLRCRWPWPFCNEHSTRYEERKGMFPLCETCWKDLETPEARLPYYVELVDMWRRQSNDDASLAKLTSDYLLECLHKEVLPT